MSVALYDLRCPSYDYVKRMTWAEFQIRLRGFQREQKREWYKIRELAWVTYIAPHQDPKKMKKSKNAFWPMDKKTGVTDKMREAMIQAQIEYMKKKNG